MNSRIWNFVISFVFHFIHCHSDRNVYQKRDHSLSKPYNTISGFGAGSALWDFTGNAMITGNYIRLTSEKKGEHGHLWNNIRTKFKNWEAHLHFKIKSTNGKQLGGDGLALWLTRERMARGNVFGATNNFRGLGVFLDTFANDWNNDHKFPYVSAMVTDGDIKYDHDKDGMKQILDGCYANIRDQPHETFLLVRYENRKLTVKTDVDGQNNWLACFEVDGVKLPRGLFFGISAATGDLTDNHDIISLKVYEIEQASASLLDESDPDIGVDKKDVIEVEDDSDSEVGGSWFKWFLVLFLLIAIGGVLYYFATNNDSKRFY